MEIPVLIEPVADNGYRGGAFGYFAEGATKKEVVRKLREMITSRLAAGALVVSLDLPSPGMKDQNPWLAIAGMFKDDPLLKEWKKSMAEYRRGIDAEPDLP